MPYSYNHIIELAGKDTLIILMYSTSLQTRVFKKKHIETKNTHWCKNRIILGRGREVRNVVGNRGRRGELVISRAVTLHQSRMKSS